MNVVEQFRAERRFLIEESPLTGRALCARLAAITDSFVAGLFEEASRGINYSAALIATGGYGRGELAPYSDLDLVLVHDTKQQRVEELASALWYPLWDLGFRVGHAVRDKREQRKASNAELDTATAMLTGRFLAGDRQLATAVIDDAHRDWYEHRNRWLGELQLRVRERQSGAGEVAYTLEPDLKDGHGGIRDVQSLWWAEAAGLELLSADRDALSNSYDVLVDARVALHRATQRTGEILRLEDQDAVAIRAGYSSADALMASVAAAARSIAWIVDESWGRIGRSARGTSELVAPGVVEVDGEIELADGIDPRTDPTLVLQCAVAAARRSCRIGRRSLDRLADEVEPWPDMWPVGATDELIALLLEGQAAIPVLEALDQRGLVSRLLPEWEPVRSRPQRNAYHRYTVDRHLWQAAANAAGFTERVKRPDLLVLGALFHDIGKGYPGDHTDAGMELVARIGPRLGLSTSETTTLVRLVEHHLLLPDVAVRRDLADEATIRHVADAVESSEFLDLLWALTEADSKATGPAAWNAWKAELIADLVGRVRHVLGGGDPSEVTWRLFPDEATLAKMARGVIDIAVTDDDITVINPDAPGTFSRVAGVLSLYGLDVLSARAHSEEAHAGEPPVAASQFKVSIPAGGCDWEALVNDLGRAVRGELAIEARLADRAQTYRRRRATQAARPGPPALEFHDWASSNATVIEVRAPNKIGVLYRTTKALAELGLDIRHATVQSIGMEVVDTFYVRTAAGELLTDPRHRDEVRRAVLHALS